MTVINFKKKNNNWPTLVHTMAPHSINSLFYFIFVWSQHLTFPSYSRCFFNTSTKFHESNAQAFRVLIHRSEFKTILYPFHHLGFQNLMASGSQLEPRVLQIRFKFKLLTTKKKRKQVHESENIPKIPTNSTFHQRFHILLKLPLEPNQRIRIFSIEPELGCCPILKRFKVFKVRKYNFY